MHIFADEAEARKRFKTYVTLLSTIKNENNQKYLILRKKYLHECPSEDVVERAVEAAGNASVPSSPGAGSIVSVSEGVVSPLRQPPPYKAPPEVQQSPLAAAAAAPSVANAGLVVHQDQVESYRECVNEFTAAMQRIDPARLELQPSPEAPDAPKTNEPKASAKSISRANSVDETANKENIPRFSFSSGASTDSSVAEKVSGPEADVAENPISVKEATRKFNRMASEEEAKIISPPAKKKPEKVGSLLCSVCFASSQNRLTLSPVIKCGCRYFYCLCPKANGLASFAACPAHPSFPSLHLPLSILHFLWEAFTCIENMSVVFVGEYQLLLLCKNVKILVFIFLFSF